MLTLSIGTFGPSLIANAVTVKPFCSNLIHGSVITPGVQIRKTLTLCYTKVVSPPTSRAQIRREPTLEETPQPLDQHLPNQGHTSPNDP